MYRYPLEGLPFMYRVPVLHIHCTTAALARCHLRTPFLLSMTVCVSCALQLADLNIGVIGLKWRQVACDYVGPARIDGKDASSTPSNNGASSGDGAPVTRTQHSFGELFAA